MLLIGGRQQDNDDEHALNLSDEQRAVLQRVKTGRSVFFTGSAGTGKSVLLRHIIKWCTKTAGKKTAVTASTGIAGYHIGGSTLHSWAGIGIGIGTADSIAKAIKKRGKYENDKAMVLLGDRFQENKQYYIPLENWLTTEVLIIDESEYSRLDVMRLFSLAVTYRPLSLDDSCPALWQIGLSKLSLSYVMLNPCLGDDSAHTAPR